MFIVLGCIVFAGLSCWSHPHFAVDSHFSQFCKDAVDGKALPGKIVKVDVNISVDGKPMDITSNEDETK